MRDKRYEGSYRLRSNKEFLRRLALVDPIDALKDELDGLCCKTIRNHKDNDRMRELARLLK